jgi:hypothetical protein
MAKKPGQEKSLHQLRQEIAHSRDRLGRDLGGLRYELDFPLKFRKSFQRQTVVWVTAAVVLGVVLAVMPARTKKIQVKARPKTTSDPKEGLLGAGLAIGALKIAATLLKPAVANFISKKMKSYAADAGHKW